MSTTPSFSRIFSKGNKVLMLIYTNLIIFTYNTTALALISNQTLTQPFSLNLCSLGISYNSFYLIADANNIIVYSLINYTQLYSGSCTLCSIRNTKFGFNNYVLYASLAVATSWTSVSTKLLISILY